MSFSTRARLAGVQIPAFMRVFSSVGKSACGAANRVRGRIECRSPQSGDREDEKD
jgi:hypothetical protein